MKTSILILSLFILGSSITFAQDATKTKRQFKKGEHANFLNLTKEQQTKIDSLRLLQFKEMRDFSNKLNEKQAQKKTLLSADKPDVKKINSLLDEIGKIRTEQSKAQVAHHLKIRSLLTAEQQLKFDAMGLRLGSKNFKTVRGSKFPDNKNTKRFKKN